MFPRVLHWDPKWGPMSPEAMRRRLGVEGYSVLEYHYTPGTIFPFHQHSVDKIDTVLRGRLRICWEGGEAILAAGDMIAIPAGVRHSAEVIGEETVLTLDATRPAM